jgi:peptide-methionine (S)-S-oxide reductase
MLNFSKKLRLPTPDEALPGRTSAICSPEKHAVSGHSLKPPFPNFLEEALFGLGCFWGAEKKFWQQPGVYCTAVGYAGGFTKNPTYEEVCTGMTGHTEVVKVVFDPKIINYEKLLMIFWEAHNPTQGMQQGVDIGTQYRSAIFTFSDKQAEQAIASKAHYQIRLNQAGFGAITTEILPAAEFYFAENYHQQYLIKSPRLTACDIPLAQTGRPSYLE